MREWREAEWKEDFKQRWWDASVGLDCKCGAKGIVLDHQDEGPRKCDECGRQYRLIVRLETLDP